MRERVPRSQFDPMLIAESRGLDTKSIQTAPMGSDSLNAAIDRFFRSYFNQLQEPDPDTLLNFLNALYGLNDKLKKQAGRDLFGSANFLALKALRNLFHHHVEPVHEIKLIPLDELPPMTTDLMIVCLVPRSLIERAQVETERRHQENPLRICRIQMVRKYCEHSALHVQRGRGCFRGNC
ncbi:MAG: hypothetical protein KIT82_20655 [Bradyrhizobium sp.]|nr:hypothetical protein [Bradyrhizobium sp.]